MFEQLAIQQTPVAAQIYTQQYFDAPKTSGPLQERRFKEPAQTLSTSLEASVVPSRGVGTSTLSDISERRRAAHNSPTSRVGVGFESQVDKTRNDRVTLLARKYAGEIDNEESARLEILTERLNRLVPLVEAATVERVADIVAVAERSKTNLSALKAKYKV